MNWEMENINREKYNIKWETKNINTEKSQNTSKIVYLCAVFSKSSNYNDKK